MQNSLRRWDWFTGWVPEDEVRTRDCQIRAPQSRLIQERGERDGLQALWGRVRRV